ncbi:MAG: DUF4148 domain-containing protein [Duganella sp.]
MSTTTKNLLRAATVAFAIAATATTVTSALAQEAPRGAAATAPATVAATAAATTNAAATAVTINGKPATAKAPAGLTREQVKAEVIEARKNGTLLQSEADFEAAFLRQQQAH